MTSNILEKNDNEYSKIMIQKDTLEFYSEALKYYLSIINGEKQKIDNKDYLKSALGKDLLSGSALDKEEGYITELNGLIEQTIANWQTGHEITFIEIVHKDIRIIKAVGMMFIEKLKEEKADLLVQELSENTLKHLEYKITLLRNKLSMGVFKDAKLWPLLVKKPHKGKTILRESYATEIHTYEVDIIDPVLRKRCLDLYNRFTENGCSDRYDTVLTEATRILEDRIRSLTNAPADKMGPDLATYAFGSDDPKLKLSDSKSEQEGLHLLYRGVFGWIRNPVHHRLVPNLQKERVLQLLCLIDYLLSLAEESYSRSMINGNLQ
ncbi:MAG: TIGR02391 family protein [bacterium]